MTWILGSAIPFGYGALISDTRATWPDGGHVDALQKIYPVGKWMMAGFAGSVEFGFKLIANMQRYFGPIPPGYGWSPQIAAWRWHRRARLLFSAQRSEVQKLSSSILLVGVSPCISGPFHISRCIRMRAPSFTPEFGTVSARWMSIGTGATEEMARSFADQDFFKFIDTHAKGEIMNPGGAAFSTATAVGLHLARNPLAQISPQLQIGTVWQDKHVISTLESQMFGPAWSAWRRVEPAGLATSWKDFQQIAKAAGLSAAAAVTT